MNFNYQGTRAEAFHLRYQQVIKNQYLKINLEVKSCQRDSFFICLLLAKIRKISTKAGMIKTAHAVPKIKPVRKREKCVFAQIPKIPKDQSIAIGTIAKKSQKRGNDSVFSIGRKTG